MAVRRRTVAVRFKAHSDFQIARSPSSELRFGLRLRPRVRLDVYYFIQIFNNFSEINFISQLLKMSSAYRKFGQHSPLFCFASFSFVLAPNSIPSIATDSYGCLVYDYDFY